MIEKSNDNLTYYDVELIERRGDFRHKSDREAIDCCALGLVEESAEFLEAYAADDGDDANWVSELGDVLWYAVTAAHRLDATLQDLVTCGMPDPGVVDETHRLLPSAAKFAGRVKKWLHHDRPIDRETFLRNLSEIVTIIRGVAPALGTVADANIAKIRKRFPSGGFTAAEANARVDEAPGALDATPAAPAADLLPDHPSSAETEVRVLRNILRALVPNRHAIGRIELEAAPRGSNIVFAGTVSVPFDPSGDDQVGARELIAALRPMMQEVADKYAGAIARASDLNAAVDIANDAAITKAITLISAWAASLNIDSQEIIRDLLRQMTTSEAPSLDGGDAQPPTTAGGAR